MQKLKLTSWNVEHFAKLYEGVINTTKTKRKEAIAKEIREINPDILCILEGPKNLGHLKDFLLNNLANDYMVVEAADGKYSTLGKQWIWFLARQNLASKVSLLPVDAWDEFSGKSWNVNYWGIFQPEPHRHYRHPQTLVLDWNGLRVEFIGLHLKSKFVQKGQQLWETGGADREIYVRESLKARIKLATEALNVRRYIDAKFRQVETPAIFVLGDLNDGPGQEYFEEKFLFFDLVSNLQGDVFLAQKFLNHALFDFPDEMRWSVRFDDFVENIPKRKLLIDHIMFTQGLVNENLPLTVKSHAGKVEHEIHELINASLSNAAKTSDHRPVTVEISVLD